MISLMTSSATERELAKGELKTAIPALAAASRSTWFVPIQKHPIVKSYRRERATYPGQPSTRRCFSKQKTTHLRNSLDDPLRDLGLAPNPHSLIPTQPLDQLVLPQRLADQIHMIPLIPQILSGVLRNVLEEEDPDLSGLFPLGRRGGRDVGREEGV